MARLNSANVLQSTAGGRRLWHLSASGDKFTVDSEMILLASEACPPEMVAKDWHDLFRKKINVAWLPPDKVFFRAAQLPSSDPAEITSMVELQMEKHSPLPVTHIVWSVYILPRSEKPEALQTVLIVIAARSAVEEFLGEIDKEGFQPDRLEAPGLEQLLAAKFSEDGVWIFTGGDDEPVLAVWWYGGTIQNVTLVSLSAGPDRGAQLRGQLEQIAWAGELEGWLTGPLKIHLLTAHTESAYWESTFKDWGESVEILPPTPAKELAALSAQRCANGAPSTSLLPPEFAARYHQQYIDRLWMHGLMTVMAAYVLGVLFYWGMLMMFQMKDTQAKQELASLGTAYTNAQQHIEQIRILQDRQALKYAALDCWMAVAENLPETITVDNLYFQRSKLELRGTVNSDSQEDVESFNQSLLTNAYDASHKLLFSEVSPPVIRIGPVKAEWSFNCTLQRQGAP